MLKGGYTSLRLADIPAMFNPERSHYTDPELAAFL